MTSSRMPFWAADRTSTGKRHQTAGRFSATTLSSTPTWKAIRYSARPAPPITAASPAPQARSLPGWLASRPIDFGPSPDRASR